VPLEPAVIDFQNVTNVGGGGGDGVRVVSFQMMNFLDHAVRTDVGGGKRVRTIFHPEIRRLRVRKNKQHGAFVGDVGAKHHAGHFLPGGGGHFSVQGFRAKIDFDRRQFGLRPGGQLAVHGSRRRRGFSLFATGHQSHGQDQRNHFCPFHDSKLPKAAWIFNRETIMPL